MTSVEIVMVVSDCLEALELYKSIFDINIIEYTNLELGLNEAVFDLYGMRFHLLDENADYMLNSSKVDTITSISFNVTVMDIEKTFNAAVKNGCKVYQEIKTIDELGISNALFYDKFGHAWLLHQKHN